MHPPRTTPCRLELLSADEPDNGGFDNTRGGRTRWADMDYGPFFSSTLGLPLNKANVTPKAITIALDKEKKHAIAFDTELMRSQRRLDRRLHQDVRRARGAGGPSGCGRHGAVSDRSGTGLGKTWNGRL